VACFVAIGNFTHRREWKLNAIAGAVASVHLKRAVDLGNEASHES
jgi:hypothetical protein